MHEIVQFVIHHWELCLAFLVLLAVIAKVEMSSQVSGIKLLTPQQVTYLLNRKQAVIFDIREEKIYLEGHIIGSVRVPVNELEDHLKKFQKYKSKPVIVVCLNGQQSPRIGAKLRKLGFSEVYALKGGIQAWRQIQLPLARGEAANG